MTRARQGLWISGDAQKPTANNPSGLDKDSWYGKAIHAGLKPYILPDTTPHATGSTQESKPTSTSTELKSVDAVEDFVLEWTPAKESHDQLVHDVESGLVIKVFADQADPIEPDSELLEEGTHFHRLLEFLTMQSADHVMSSMPSEIEVMKWLGIHQAQAQTAIGHAQRILEAPELKSYLTAGHWIAAWNELDILSKEGKSYRIDRLVEFDDHLAILDYKLSIPEVGSEQYGKYRGQLQHYQQELARIRADKPSKAYLISAQGQMLEVK